MHDRHRNLVVAATGTGKTVVAALDYQRLAREARQLDRLLFVAHREEILEQSLRTYREVLGDGTSASSTSAANARAMAARLRVRAVTALLRRRRRSPATHFDIVVIDEFHHAEAPTYRRLLEHLTPENCSA